MRVLYVLLLFIISSPLFSQPVVERSYSRQQLTEDMQFLVTTVEHVHPNPYHAISKEKFKALTDSLRATLKDSVTIREAWKVLSLMMAAYDEGHSSINYPVELQAQIRSDSVPVFPLLVKDFDGEGLTVRFDLSYDSLLHTGDLITHINGETVPALMARLSALYGGLTSWRHTQVLRDFSGQLVLQNISPPYRIGYTSYGLKKETIVQPLRLSKLLARLAEVRKKNAIAAVTPANYSFQRTAENAGYINFRSMKDLPAFERFLDSVFTDIHNKPVSGLIIDLRQNGGGNSALGEKLIDYISSKPYRMGGGSTWKVSDEYKTFIREQAGNNAVYANGPFQSYLNRNSGTVISALNSKLHTPGKNKLRYNGKVCVLTGPNTFSSANMLSNAIKDYQLATIIGEPTGEPCNDYGELYWNKLPHTGLQFFTCTKQFIRANGDAADPNPVLPDITVKQSPHSLKDEVLEFAKEWVRGK